MLYLRSILVLFIFSSCYGLKELEHDYEPAVNNSNSGIWDELNLKADSDIFYPLNNHFEALEWRLRCIDSASSSIDMQVFLWKNDFSGRLLINSIIDAANRQVKVRILIDDVFTVKQDKFIAQINKHPNISIRIYNPFKRRYRSFGLRYIMNAGDFSRIDHRMHNKALIVDQKTVIFGGRNIGDEYFGIHPQFNFRDMDVLALGSVSKKLSDSFSLFWSNRWSYPSEEIIKNKRGQIKIIREPIGGFFPLNETQERRKSAWQDLIKKAIPATYTLKYDLPKDDHPNRKIDTQLSQDIYQLIKTAEEKLCIISPYFIPTPELEQAIFEAESRGVDVRILTNSLQSNNHTIAHSFYRKHMKKYLESGADLHEYRSSGADRRQFMFYPVKGKSIGLHAKVILIDDELSLIGSPNLDPRSLKWNSEAAVLIKSKEFCTKIRKLLGVDFSLRNSWKLEQNDQGKTLWKSYDQTLKKQPRNSRLQLLESWFLGLLPVEDKI